MNRSELYSETVNILYDAYYNNRLEYRNYHLCPIGNIIRSKMGYDVSIKNNSLGRKSCSWYNKGDFVLAFPWHSLLYQNLQRLTNLEPEDLALAEIHLKVTGYSKDELIKIEMAFESNYEEEAYSDYLSGVINVLKVLDEIHQVNVAGSCATWETNENHGTVDSLVKRHQAVLNEYFKV